MTYCTDDFIEISKPLFCPSPFHKNLLMAQSQRLLAEKSKPTIKVGFAELPARVHEKIVIDLIAK